MPVYQVSDSKRPGGTIYLETADRDEAIQKHDDLRNQGYEVYVNAVYR